MLVHLRQVHPLFYYFTLLPFYLFTFLSRVLACAHTSLNHIHHIVAKFLAL